MARVTSISRLTDERSRHVHPVPFIILGLGGRNNVQFGRASDMICRAGIHHESLYYHYGHHLPLLLLATYRAGPSGCAYYAVSS